MKKKIFHIIPTLKSGGAERLLTDVVLNTAGGEFEQTVIVFGQSAFFAPLLTQGGVNVVDLGIANTRRWFAAARKIADIVNEENPDLIITWLYDATIATRLMAFTHRKISVVTTLHSPDYEPETIAAGNWPRWKVAVLRLVDKISAMITRPNFVSCSHFVADSYRRRLNIEASRIKVIHNFTNPASLRSEPGEATRIRASLNISEDDFVFLNVGRLDPQKGQSYLIEAFQQVLKEAPNSRLAIIGTGDLEKLLVAQAEGLGISERVHLLGRRSDIGACLEMADVFVFPALFEGFGIALVEAMARRLPCIASRLEVLMEIVEDNVSALLVEPRSARDLADAMLRLYREPETREQLAEKGYSIAKERFYSDVIIPEWKKLFEDLSA